jgi:uncharacterized iron-regulated membrane protein
LPGSKARRWKNQATKKLAWFHRWLGVATCLVFTLWFASGAVMLFKPFPSLPRAEQFRLEAPIALDAVTISPRAAAHAGAEPLLALRLVQRGAAPAYIATTASKSIAIDAGSGKRLPDLTADTAAASGRTTLGAATAPSPLFDYDQWIVHNHFDPLRPFYRLDANDDAGTSLYLSAKTGEFVQRTRFADRAWNWVGAVLHWAYFTPLRASFTAWDRTVWILSFIALLVAITGTILGVVRTVAAQRQRTPSLTFYRLRWMRWHHLLGLFASIFVLTWILSGWLSMDHGRLFSRGAPTAEQLARYEGTRLADALPTMKMAAIPAGTKQLDFTVVGGQLLATAWQSDGTALTLGANGTRLSPATIRDQIGNAARAAFPGAPSFDIAPIDPTATYALAEGWPASAVRVRLGAGLPDVYADGADGRLLTVMNDSRASYAWIYYALHTFNFPGLTTRPLLRQTLVLIPLMLGFLFSITGVVLGIQRLRKSV